MAKEVEVMSGEDEDSAAAGAVIVVDEPKKEVQRVEGELADKKVATREEDDEDDEEADERRVKNAADGDDDDSPEGRREKNRIKRQLKKERIEASRRELAYLRRRNDELERSVAGIETTLNRQQRVDVDAQLAATQREFAQAEDIMAKALAAGNHADVVKAMGFRDAARDRFRELSQVKVQQERQARQPVEAQVAPAVQRQVQAFQRDHEWFDPNGGDEDSLLVRALDTAVANDGYDPASPEYWKELKKRIAKRLPGKVNGHGTEQDDEDDDQTPPARKPRGGPAVGSSRQGASSTKPGEIYLNPERVQALKEAGLWDNPKDRARMAKKYAEVDRLARQNRGG